MGSNERSDVPRDLVRIGPHRFDPKEAASRARRRADADRRRLDDALGQAPRDATADQRKSWLLQFAHRPDERTVDRFRQEHRLRLAAGLSSRVFVERMTRREAAAVRREPAVRACIPYSSELREMRSTLPSPGEDGQDRRLKLGLIDPPDEDLGQTLTQLGFRAVEPPRTSPSGVLLVVEGGRQADPAALLLLDEVEWIDEVRALGPMSAEATAAAQGGEAAGDNPIWEEGLHGEDQVIGVIDGGLPDLRHAFFRDPSGNAPGDEHRKVVVADERPDSGPEAHATRVCGCAVGDDVDAPGAHPHRGGAWAARLAYSDGDGQTLQDREEAFALLAERGARVFSMSVGEVFGNTPAPYTDVAAFYDDFLWRFEYQLVAGSIANNWNPYHGAPGTAKNPIGVAGTHTIPKHDEFFTGRHGTADGRRKPDLLAVGEDVETSSVTEPDNRSRITGGDGTSWATPHVAAAATLTRQYFVDGFYPSGRRTPEDARTPTGALLKAMLLNATVPLRKDTYPSPRAGWGRLRLADTLFFAGDSKRLWFVDVPNGFGFSEADSRHRRGRRWQVDVPAGARTIKATMVFNDPAGPAKVGDAVVNRLYMIVAEPLERFDIDELIEPVYFSNHLDDDGQSRRVELGLGAHPDPEELRSNVHQVVVRAPMPAGRWRLTVVPEEVDAANTPRPLHVRRAQGFALVVRVDLD